MQARLILGPAGSGKTFHCLAEIRAALAGKPDGPPLLLIAPKQATYQLERQLLADASLPGYTRLHILSFERLAQFVSERLQKTPPQMLDEEGRLMVLRALLTKKRDQLDLFRASARLTGFAQHLSLTLRELQRQKLTPESLLALAEKTKAAGSLAGKLRDLATLLRDYLDWLAARGLQDADQLLDFATQALRAPHPPLEIGGLWVDGFSELAPQELDLLAELAPQSAGFTMTFCLDAVPTEKVSWLGHWSLVRRMYHQCQERFAQLPGCKLTNELIPRHAGESRFAGNAPLQHLEANWEEPEPLESAGNAIRIAACTDLEGEITLAAREILRFVHDGGRYRDVAVLTRSLQPYHALLANIFARYEIPFFLDRRESVSHHPLAELTRNALRTVVFGWKHEDWFAALKTGFVPAAEPDIDRLENEALARGWRGSIWQKPIVAATDPDDSQWVESIRSKIIGPFNKLALQLAQQGNRPDGAQLAAALREFWRQLAVDETLEKWSSDEEEPRATHLTVRDQMRAWLENIELAFLDERLPMQEWLPILDAGLAGLTVGVIPPVLDQVLIGAIDRSRNPEIRLAVVLGMNEGVFPAPPDQGVLLTDADRVELEKHDVKLVNVRQQIGRERYYAYIACTRARERLVLTYSTTDESGNPLNPSPFLSHLHRLFPSLETESFPRVLDWRRSEHASELIAPMLLHQVQGTASQMADLARLQDLPALASLKESLRHLISPPPVESLSPALALRLYGPGLRTSVSRMEQFAACPFRFFVHSGLRAEERILFELDIRDQGSFQHDVLHDFHEQLRSENKRWRDITPKEARERVKVIALSRMVSFRDGLLQASDESKFTARVMTESLQDFVEVLVGWMREQYAFDPAAAEMIFGEGSNSFPPWELDLGDGHRLLLRGRIDRVDICPDPTGDTALCVVLDYKSSQKQLDSLMMEHGLQLQLPAYLNVLRHWPNPRPDFNVARLIPAGVFYVSLRGRYVRGDNRNEALADAEDARKLAYRHTGRFDAQHLRKLDQRDVRKGDQFNYSINNNGSISKNSREALETGEFMAMLDDVETALKTMGRAIYAGNVAVDPFRKGNAMACDQCEYQSICRIDPWTHTYRLLKKT